MSNRMIDIIALSVVGIALLGVIFLPMILTSTGEIDFTNTGEIGDTIGGIAAPVVGLASAILLYLALKSQVETNKKQEDNRLIESERREITSLLNEVKSSIDNFTYKTLDESEFGDPNLPEYKGSIAFYQLFDDYICKFHYNSNEEKLYTNPKLAELVGLLDIIRLLFFSIHNSSIWEKHTYQELAKHQFEYRVYSRLRSEYPGSIESYYCEHCEMEHGFPPTIVRTIRDIMDCVDDPIH